MWVDHFLWLKNFFKTFHFFWEMFSPCTRSRRPQCWASTGCFQSSFLQSPLWRENQDTYFYSHFWSKPFICVYLLLQTCHQIQLEEYLTYFTSLVHLVAGIVHIWPRFRGADPRSRLGQGGKKCKKKQQLHDQCNETLTQTRRWLTG